MLRDTLRARLLDKWAKGMTHPGGKTQPVNQSSKTAENDKQPSANHTWANQTTRYKQLIRDD